MAGSSMTVADSSTAIDSPAPPSDGGEIRAMHGWGSILNFFPSTRLGSVARHTTHYFLDVPREFQHVYVTHTVGCHSGGGYELLEHRGSPKHRAPVLEPCRISLEHSGRTLLIMSCMITTKQSVLETLRFSTPSGNLQWRTCLCALPSTPFNARCDGLVRIGHGTPPLLGRLSLELHQSYVRVRRTKDARESTHRVSARCSIYSV